MFYKAVTKEGKSIDGLIEARDEKEAANYLRSKDFIPIKIEKKEKGSLRDLIPFFSSKVKSANVVVFTRQLSSMLTSGITLVRSLEIIKGQTTNSALVAVLDSMIRDIEEGKNLSSALTKYPDIFSSVYVSLIKAAESSGLLDKALLRLAETLEKQQKLKGTIKGALAYPVIVIVMMIGVMFVMMVFVIPQLSTLYEGLGAELPLPTKIVVAMSKFSISFWPVIIAFVGLFVFLFRTWHKTVEGEIAIDSIILKLPVFGKLIKESILVEFSRTLGTLLGSGTLVIDSLGEVSGITGNVVYKNAIMDIAQRVEKGLTMGNAMSAYALFPQNLVELVKIGEQTGKLDETLIRASEYFENEFIKKIIFFVKGFYID